MSQQQPRSHPPEYRTIVACLSVVRRRLFAVRLLERIALGLTTGALMALPLVAARLLLDRYGSWTAVLALVPAASGVWMWARALRWARPGIPASVVRLGAAVALLAALLVVAMAAWPAVVGAWPLRGLSVGLMVAGALAGAATVRRVGTRAAAIFVDQQVGLRERVSTALEILDAPPATSPVEAAFRNPLVGSAVQACAAVRGAKVGYARVDKRVYPVAAAAALAALGVTFLTPLPARAIASHKPYAIVVENTARLADKLKEIEEQQAKKGDEPAKALDPLRNALTDLRKGNMTPFEMQAKINEAKGQLQQKKEELDASEKAEQALERVKALEQLQNATKQEKDAQTADNQDGADGQSKKSAAADARKAAAESAASQVAGMNAGEKQDVAQGLKDAAAQAKDDPQLQKSLNAAADAAEKGDTRKLSQSLSDAAARMGQQSAQRQLSGQALKDAMDAIDQANAGGKSADEQQAGGGQQGNNQQANAGQQGQQGQQGKQGQQGQQGNSPDQQSGAQQGQQGQQGQQANSGSNQGSKPGGSQQGSQSSQGASAGQETAGSGSTNMHTPGGPGDKKEGGPIGKQGTFVKIYDESHIDHAGDITKVTGQLNTAAPAAGTSEVLGPADNTHSQIGTYNSQLPAARQKAMDDLSTQNVPPEYRDVIRDFYQQ